MPVIAKKYPKLALHSSVALVERSLGGVEFIMRCRWAPTEMLLDRWRDLSSILFYVQLPPTGKFLLGAIGFYSLTRRKALVKIGTPTQVSMISGSINVPL